jgi:hypothetical protein
MPRPVKILSGAPYRRHPFRPQQLAQNPWFGGARPAMLVGGAGVQSGGSGAQPESDGL